MKIYKDITMTIHHQAALPVIWRRLETRQLVCHQLTRVRKVDKVRED